MRTGWDEVLTPIIDRYRRHGQTVEVRGDAAFAMPELYEALERRCVRYAIRLPANDVLERPIEDLLTRPWKFSFAMRHFFSPALG